MHLSAAMTSCKLVILAAFVSVVSCGRVAAPEADIYDTNPQYNYGYSIQDGLSGDTKNLQESRDGDVVKGSYSLVEPDGTRRIVEYTADSVNGFNAVVRREPEFGARKSFVAASVKASPPPIAYRPRTSVLSAPVQATVISPTVATRRLAYGSRVSVVRAPPVTPVVYTSRTPIARIAHSSRTIAVDPAVRGIHAQNSFTESVRSALHKVKSLNLNVPSVESVDFGKNSLFPTSLYRSSSGHILPGSAIVTAL